MKTVTIQTIVDTRIDGGARVEPVLARRSGTWTKSLDAACREAARQAELSYGNIGAGVRVLVDGRRVDRWSLYVGAPL